MTTPTTAGPAATPAARAGRTRRTARGPKSKLKALWLVGPALAVLAVVIGYPILRAIWLSFQADRHIDPDTGMFVEGGFGGLQHYLYWLTQRCMLSDGTVGTCAPGTLSTDFWPAVGITLFFAVVTVSLPP